MASIDQQTLLRRPIESAEVAPLAVQFNLPAASGEAPGQPRPGVLAKVGQRQPEEVQPDSDYSPLVT